ncbi:hypothetical protein [Paraoerskovia marina]|nr:hypothetical protein [Paraoerskovia marina]
MPDRSRWISPMAWLVVVSAACGGCSAAAEDPKLAPVEDVRGSYTLDRETGSITFPVDRFGVTAQEEAVLGSAGSVVLETCARARGVEFLAWESRYVPEYEASTLYGVWTSSLVERFGFVAPMSDADLRANGVMTESPLDVADTGATGQARDWGLIDPSPDAENVLAECRDSAEFQAVDSAQFYRGEAWTVPIADASHAVERSAPYEDLADDLHRCLRDEGLEPDGLSVEGADPSQISAEQIELALRVVHCKDEVDFVHRAVVEVSRAQLPVVERYEDELTAHRAAIDEALDRAQEVLAGSDLG